MKSEIIINYISHSYNKTTVKEGIASVLVDGLDAFIYDGTVLDYLVAQDEGCRLLTVGSWYAMTGNYIFCGEILKTKK